MARALNPEFVRNVRAQLRPGKMLTAAIICGVLSLAAGAGLAFTWVDAAANSWGLTLLSFALGAQVYVLLLGGGIACLHAIQREKESNTFDFQRVTRLTPRELALGKLFGAPALSYFVALCLLPAAIVGAVTGGAAPAFVVAAYVILLLGAICYHAFALMVSMLVERTAATAAVLVFIVLVFFPWATTRWFLGLSEISPLFATELSSMTSWANVPWVGGVTDMLLGRPVHHAPVLIVLYLAFTAWFLLAVVRNIKRDPAVYELYSPAQALGLALFVNLILIGFFRWSSTDPLNAQQIVLGFNATLFMLLGLALIRNRDRLRRVWQAGSREPRWITVTHPAPYIVVGLLAMGLVAVAVQQAVQNPDPPWGAGVAIFKVVFLAAWLARDILFLQWMNLRRGHRRLTLGVLYLVVGYVGASVLFGALGLYRTPLGAALATAVVPASILNLWLSLSPAWTLALVVQVAVVGVFVRLQRRAVAELTMTAGA